MYDLCNWLLDHTHGMNHTHPHPHIHPNPHIHTDPHIHPDGGSGGGPTGPNVPPFTEEGVSTGIADDGTMAALTSIANPSPLDLTKTIGLDPTLNAVPSNVEKSGDQVKLREIRDSLGIILSKRVFLTGGGYAPGVYSSLVSKTNINPYNGEGVPGGYKSAPFSNVRRENPADLSDKFTKNIMTMESILNQTQPTEGNNLINFE